MSITKRNFSEKLIRMRTILSETNVSNQIQDKKFVSMSNSFYILGCIAFEFSEYFKNLSKESDNSKFFNKQHKKI